jgi:sec-independent protein translocase protein TatA
MFHPILLFIFDSPTQIIFVILVVVLLFGATRLPQLAKSLGQSRKAFKDALREGDEEDNFAPTEPPKQIKTNSASTLSDEEILAEMQRRAEAKSKA